MKRRWQGILTAAGLLFLVASAQAADKPSRTRPSDAALAAYVEKVRAEAYVEERSPGSIWVNSGRLTRLPIDLKVLRPHDLISIVVSESLAASTDGAVKNARSSNASSALTSLFGKLSAANTLQSLVNQNSSSGLNAQGQSVTNSSLSTILGGEVVDVLPNGVLVVQAVRNVTFNQQTQTIKLRGLVRPDDVNASNRILSTAITNLELEVVGKGIIDDFTRRPNVIVRLIERLLVF